MTMSPRPTPQSAAACRLTRPKTWLLPLLLPALLSAAQNDAGKRVKPKPKQPATAPASRLALYPPDRCVIDSPTVQIIATVADSQGQTTVTVDGKPVETRRMRISNPGRPAGRATGSRRSALVGTASLAPGQHVIAVGPHKSRVWISTSKDLAKAPADWPVFFPHPGRIANCALCHKTKDEDGERDLGPAHEPAPCLACHDLDEFKLTHSHRLESLAACQMCHAPHGGTTKALLIGKPKALCAKCHD